MRSHPIAVVLCALSLGGCSSGSTPGATVTATPSPTPTKADYFIHGRGSISQPVTVQDTVKGQPVYVLEATDVYYSTSSAKGRFLNDKVLFYKGKTVRLTLTAPVADVNRTTYDFVLHGGVKAKSALGITLTCDVMSYNGNTKLLTATGDVRAVDVQGDVVTGDKAVADLDLQQIHMSGHVGIGR
jgi:LPS export ABC transporter protein LptC